MTEGMVVNLVSVTVQKPEAVNLILGQAHFIKAVEDLHEALVTCVPGITRRGILEVVDGACPKGVETENDVAARKVLLRRLGHRL